MNQDMSTDRTATTALAFTTFPLDDRSHFTNFEFAEESVMERGEPRSETISSSSADWDSGSSADWVAGSSVDWDAGSSAEWDRGSIADSGSSLGAERREHGEYWTQAALGVVC